MEIALIHQFEYWLEDGFSKILAPIGPKVFDTVTRLQTATTPRIEVKAFTGKYAGGENGHRHPFKEQAVIGGVAYNVDIFDAYEGFIEVLAVTNRTTSGEAGNHRFLLGKIRAAMSKWLVWKNWQGTVILPTDVRPEGTVDSFEDDQDCDYTVERYYILFNVNTEGVWPDSLT